MFALSLKLIIYQKQQKEVLQNKAHIWRHPVWDVTNKRLWQDAVPLGQVKTTAGCQTRQLRMASASPRWQPLPGHVALQASHQIIL